MVKQWASGTTRYDDWTYKNTFLKLASDVHCKIALDKQSKRVLRIVSSMSFSNFSLSFGVSHTWILSK